MDRQASERPRILVVEDDALIAQAISEILSDGGFDVVGPALAFPQALRLARTAAFDGAVLDVDLGADQGGDAIAETLCLRGAPFVFVTGRTRAEMPFAWRGFSMLPKPFTPEQLLSSVGANLGPAPTAARP